MCMDSIRYCHATCMAYLAYMASMAKIYSNTHTRSRYLVFILLIYFQHILPTVCMDSIRYCHATCMAYLACMASMAKIYSNAHTRSRYLVFILLIYFQHILPTVCMDSIRCCHATCMAYLACMASMAKIYSNTHTRSRYLVFILLIYFQHILPTLSFITLPYPTCLF